MNAPSRTPKECVSLMSECWVFLPENRYNFQKVEYELMRIHKDDTKPYFMC